MDLKTIKLKIGMKVKLSLKSRPDEWVEGEVFAFDEDSFGYVVLQQQTQTPNQTKTFKIFNSSTIARFQTSEEIGDLHNHLGLKSSGLLQDDVFSAPNDGF